MGPKTQDDRNKQPQGTFAALRQRCTIQKPGDHVSTLKMRQFKLKQQYYSESYDKDQAYIEQVPLQVRTLHRSRIMAYYKKLEEQLLGPMTQSERWDMELAYMNEVPLSVRSQTCIKFLEPRWKFLELMRQQPNYNPHVYDTMSTHFFLQQDLYVQQQMKLHYEWRKVMNRDSSQQQQRQELPVTSPTEEGALTERMQKISLAVPVAADSPTEATTLVASPKEAIPVDSRTEEDVVTEGLQKLGLAE